MNEEVRFVKDRNPKKFNGFDFDEFDEKLDEASEVLYPGEEVNARVMLGKYDYETFPLGVIIYKDFANDAELNAFKNHLRSLIEGLER